MARKQREWLPFDGDVGRRHRRIDPVPGELGELHRRGERPGRAFDGKPAFGLRDNAAQHERQAGVRQQERDAGRNEHDDQRDRAKQNRKRPMAAALWLGNILRSHRIKTRGPLKNAAAPDATAGHRQRRSGTVLSAYVPARQHHSRARDRDRKYCRTHYRCRRTPRFPTSD